MLISMKKSIRNFGAIALALAAGFFAVPAGAQVDSSAILFDDGIVRNYSLLFYATDWQAQLTANWATDSGYIPARFSDGTITLDSVGVRYKGNSSYSGVTTSPKKPYKIKFNEYRSGQKYYGAKVLNFSNGYGDPSFLREKIAYDISRKYLPTPRVNFANISVNGTLIGLFTEVEQIDKSFLTNHYDNDSMNLFKASDNGASLVYEGDVDTLYANDVELKTNETVNDWIGFIEFVKFVNTSTDSLFCADHGRFINSDNLAKFLAFNMVLSHFDSYTGSGRNFYMYQYNVGGFMLFIPWDMNLAFGGYSNSWNVYTQKALTQSNIASRPLIAKFLACPETKNQYLGYIKDMIQGPASVDSVQAAITRLTPIVRPALALDPNKLFTITAFDSNQTLRYRTSSGSIPGLIEFSTIRDSVLLQEVTDSLPVDYVLPVHTTLQASGITLTKVNGNWIVQGLKASAKLSAYDIGGRKVNFKMQSLVGGQLLLSLPQGVVFLKVVQGSHQLVYKITNT